MAPQQLLSLWLYGCMFFGVIKTKRNPIIVDFCSGAYSGTSRIISILYERNLTFFHCRCNVHRSTSPVDRTMYYIKSWNIKDASKGGGGYFNLSFTSGNSTVSIFNETKSRKMKLFQASGTKETEIKLVLYPGTKVPRRLWIYIDGDGGSLEVTCRSEFQETTTGHVSTTTRTTTAATSTLTTVPSTTTTANIFITVKATSKHSAVTINPSSPFPGNYSEEKSLAQSGVQVAPIAGGVAGALVMLAVVIAVLVFCHIKRKKSTENVDESKGSHVNPLYSVMENDIIYSVADETPTDGNVTENNNVVSKDKVTKPTYFQIEPQNKNPGYMNVAVCCNAEYDHLTVKDASLATSPGIYNHLTGDIDKSEDCYHHLGSNGEKSVNVNVDYDTAASASKAVNDLEHQDDYYSYDHLGTPTATIVTENDYDTTLPRVLNPDKQ